MKRGQQPRRAFNGVALHFCPTEQTGERTSAGEDLDEVEGEEILLFHAFDKFCVGTHSFRYKNATTFLTFQSAGLGKRQRQEESDDDEEMNLLFKPFKRLRIESKESHQERERQQTTKQHNAQHTTTHGTCKHHQCNHPFCAQKSHRNKISQNTEVGPPNHLRQQFPGRKYFIVKSRGGGGSNFPRKQTLADFLSSSSSSPSSNHPSSSSFSSSLAMVSSQQKFPAQFVIFSPGVEIPPLYFSSSKIPRKSKKKLGEDDAYKSDTENWESFGNFESFENFVPQSEGKSSARKSARRGGSRKGKGGGRAGGGKQTRRTRAFHESSCVVEEVGSDSVLTSEDVNMEFNV